MNLSAIFDPLSPPQKWDVIYGRPNVSQSCESKDLAGFLTAIWRPKVESLDTVKKKGLGLPTAHQLELF